MARETSIGTLAVDLALDTGQFQRDIREARDEITSAEASLAAAGERLQPAAVEEVGEELGVAARAARALGQEAGAAVGALGGLALEAAGLADSTERQADAHREAADNARDGAEATEELSEAVEGATVNNNDLNVSLTLVSGTMLKWLRDMGAAVTRSGAFRTALTALANPGTALVAAFAAMAVAVRQLDRALDEMAQRLASEGALGDLEGELAALEDRYRLTSTAQEVFRQRLLEEEEAELRLERARAQAGAALSPLGDLYDRLTFSTDEFKTAALELVPVLVNMQFGFNVLADEVDEAVDTLAAAREVVADVRASLERRFQSQIGAVLIREGDEAATQWQRVHDLLAFEGDDVAAVGRLREFLTGINAQLNPPEPTLPFRIETLAVSLRDLQGLPLADELSRLAVASSEVDDQLAGLAQSVIDFDAAAQDAAVTATELDLSQLDLTPLREARQANREYERGVMAIETAWQNVGERASNALGDIIFDANTARERLAALASILFDLLGAGLGGLFSGVGFGGGIAQSFGFPRRQGGGPVWSGQPFLVGERGPEVFVPAGAGQVVPAEGAGGVNVTLNVATGVDEAAFDRLLQRRLPDIQNAVALGRQGRMV